jgi:hypothetical protein
MPIAKKEIIKNRLQADGLRRVAFRFTDHLDQVYEPAVRRFPGDADLTAAMDEAAAHCEFKMGYREELKGLRSDDIVNYVLNPKHSTTKKIVKRLIREMMQDKRPETVFKLEPLVDYLRVNYTATQLQTFLGITAGQLIHMNQKIDAVLASKANMQAADDLTEDFGE